MSVRLFFPSMDVQLPIVEWPEGLTEVIPRVAARILEDPYPMLAEMEAAALRATPGGNNDATLVSEARASNRANTLHLLRALRDQEEISLDPGAPSEALNAARTLVRRGLDFEPLLRAYRLAQDVAWCHWMRHAAQECEDQEQLVDLLTISSTLLSSYVDGIVTELLDQIHRERAQLLGGALARRREAIRLILDGAPIDTTRAGGTLSYELERQHLALVLWSTDQHTPQGLLEKLAYELSFAAGGRGTLTLESGAVTVWGWCSVDRKPDREALEAVVNEAPKSIYVTYGPLDSGLRGFRRSHMRAVRAQGIVANSPTPHPRLTSYEDVRVVALAGSSAEGASLFIKDTLGDLAAGDETARRLRETVRVYLQEGGSAPQTATRLHLHRNTVLQRLARAEELLGYPVAQSRLTLSLALELCQWLGAPAPGELTDERESVNIDAPRAQVGAR